MSGTDGVIGYDGDDDDFSQEYSIVHRPSSEQKAIPWEKYSDDRTKRVGMVDNLENRLESIESHLHSKGVGDDLWRQFVSLEEEANIILKELSEVKQKHQKWRRRTWVWRIISFVLACAFGLFNLVL